MLVNCGDMAILDLFEP